MPGSRVEILDTDLGVFRTGPVVAVGCNDIGDSCRFRVARECQTLLEVQCLNAVGLFELSLQGLNHAVEFELLKLAMVWFVRMGHLLWIQ